MTDDSDARGRAVEALLEFKAAELKYRQLGLEEVCRSSSAATTCLPAAARCRRGATTCRSPPRTRRRAPKRSRSSATAATRPSSDAGAR